MYYSFLSWPSAAKDTCEQFHCTYTATCIIHFHPGHLQPKTLVNSFSTLIQLHVLFISILTICSQRHLLTASVHLYSYMYYSFLSWPSAARDTCEQFQCTYTAIGHFTVVCLVTWPLSGSESGGELVLIQTLLLFTCKSCCSHAN